MVSNRHAVFSKKHKTALTLGGNSPTITNQFHLLNSYLMNDLIHKTAIRSVNINVLTNNSRIKPAPAMPSARRLLLTWFAIGTLMLAGCQTTLKAPVLKQPVSSQQVISTQFELSGKIGVRTPQQNGSAFYAWTQVNDHFAIELTGALGIGQTRIEGIPGQVSLTSAKTGTLQATTPEELLLEATGWQAPISYLVSWVQAKPASAGAQATYDAQKRLSQLNEGGWQVQFSYADNNALPQKLLMIQPLAQGENHVTLTIQSRNDRVQP